MDAKGMSRRVRDALVTLLSGIEVDEQAAFVAVLTSTRGEFDGYPSLRVLPNDLTNTKGAVAESDRDVAFVARVYLPLNESAEDEVAAYDRMYDLTDLIVDTLDEGDFEGRLAQIDPGLGTWMLSASRGDWTVLAVDTGPVIAVDVNVTATYSKHL